MSDLALINDSSPTCCHATMAQFVPIETLMSRIFSRDYAVTTRGPSPSLTPTDRAVAASLYFVAVTTDNGPPEYFTLNKRPEGIKCLRIDAPFHTRVGVNWVQVPGQKYVFKHPVTDAVIEVDLYANREFLASAFLAPENQIGSEMERGMDFFARGPVAVILVPNPSNSQTITIRHFGIPRTHWDSNSPGENPIEKVYRK